MGMRDNACGPARNDMRRSGDRYGMQRSEGRSCSCGYGARKDSVSRDCGCGKAANRPTRDLPDNCSCGDYGLPRADYSGNCCALMHRLQQLDFSIQETILYLDAYPDCCEAKSYYRQLVCEREKVAKEYECQCGPLTAMGNGEASEWCWGKAPWPWHPDFPGNNKA